MIPMSVSLLAGHRDNQSSIQSVEIACAGQNLAHFQSFVIRATRLAQKKSPLRTAAQGREKAG